MNWKALFRLPGSGQSEFARRFAAVVKERLPSATVTMAGPLAANVTLPNGSIIRADLSHAWQECKDHPAQWEEAIERLLKPIQSLEGSPGLPIDKIVPLIRERGFIDQVTRSARTGQASVKAEPLAADLWVVYAQDTPESWKYIPDRVPLSLPELRQRGIEHLKSLQPEIESLGNSPCYILTAGEYLAASFLLLDELWDREAWRASGELIAAVPTRHVVLFAGSDSQPGLAVLRDAAREAYANGPDSLSRALLVRRNNIWEEYRGSGS